MRLHVPVEIILTRKSTTSTLKRPFAVDVRTEKVLSFRNYLRVFCRYVSVEVFLGGASIILFNTCC
jgi:hypothetical protein